MSTTLVGVGQRGDPAEAIELGCRLADPLGTDLTVVHVFRYEDHPTRHAVPQFERALHDLALEDVRKLVGDLHAPVPVDVATIGRSSPARGLHDLAVSRRATAVVIGSTHHRRAGRILLGSTAHRLLHGAPCPVAIAPPGYSAAAPAVRTIAVAYDGGPEARVALDLATRLAIRLGATLMLVAVLRPIDGPESSTGPAFGVADVVEHRRRAFREALDLAVTSLPPEVPREAHLVGGSPGHVLSETAGNCDLMVCGSRGYGPIGTVLLGSVAHHLAHHVACPLIVTPRVRVAEARTEESGTAQAALA